MVLDLLGIAKDSDLNWLYLGYFVEVAENGIQGSLSTSRSFQGRAMASGKQLCVKPPHRVLKQTGDLRDQLF